MQLLIAPDGTVRTIYTEELDLSTFGEARVTRASHVEPCEGGWSADLRPVGGPVLGPFALRSAALAAEVAWLEENRL